MNPRRRASGWNTSQSGPSTDCLYLILKLRAAMTQITAQCRTRSRIFSLRLAGTITRSTGHSSSLVRGGAPAAPACFRSTGFIGDLSLPPSKFGPARRGALVHPCVDDIGSARESPAWSVFARARTRIV